MNNILKINNKENIIYVFCGNNSIFPSAVFTTQKKAIHWIKENKLSGTLNNFPMDISVFDWAIKKEFFKVKNEYQKTPEFIQNFTCASMEHIHFENGKQKGEG